MRVNLSNADMMGLMLDLAEQDGLVLPGQDNKIHADIDPSVLCSNLKAAYLLSVERVLNIGYQLDWANHLKQNRTERPSGDFYRSDRILHYGFSNIKDLPIERLQILNDRLYENLLVSCVL